MLRAAAICTTPMCDSGHSSVMQMDSVYLGLDPEIRNQFQSSHDAILNTLNNTYSWYSTWIPFNPDCCSMQTLGQQAEQLTAQMQAAAGAVTLGLGPAGDSGSGLSLGAMVALGVAGYLALAHIGNRI